MLVDGVDLVDPMVVASALPSERPGTTPENAFAHTFEIKRDRSGFVITKKSPKYSTIVETCKPG